jgi:polyhydroxybutyrate depolymerase
MRRHPRLFFSRLAWALLIGTVACTPVTAIPSTTPAPTSTPSPTSTTIPTETAVPTPTIVPTMEPGDTMRTVTVGDLERSYRLHIPPNMERGRPAPVVLAFHGLDQDPGALEMVSELSVLSDQAGFLLVYPVGFDRSWDVGGRCCGNANRKHVDDTGFVRQLLKDLASVATVDPKRIYATGHSNGGGLVYRLACDMPETFAAIAPVSGIMVWSPCEPEQPVSLMQVHGVIDLYAPYNGGGAPPIPGVEQVMATWAEWNGCPEPPRQEMTTEIITHTVYAGCAAGTAVELYAIGPGGHSWPSKFVWNATPVIWDFFAAHPKP